MRLCLLLALILLALCPALVSADPAPRSVYIVSLSDPPLATYAGGLRAKDGRVLTPTSPAATGALRLDVAAPAAQAYLAHLERSQQLLIDQATTLAKRALAPRFFYRYASNGFALVETSSGLRGYAPIGAFPEARGLGSRPVVPAVANEGDVRSLAASNVARRDNFAESVGNAERLAAGQGFELAT